MQFEILPCVPLVEILAVNGVMPRVTLMKISWVFLKIGSKDAVTALQAYRLQ